MIFIIVFLLVLLCFSVIIWVNFNHNKIMVKKYMNLDFVTPNSSKIPIHALKEDITPVAQGDWTADISNPDLISIQFPATMYWFLKRLPKCVWNDQTMVFQREMAGMIDQEIPILQIVGLQFCIYRIPPLKNQKRPQKILFEHNIIYRSHDQINRLTMAATEKPRIAIIKFLSEKYNLPVYSSISFEELSFVEQAQ